MHAGCPWWLLAAASIGCAACLDVHLEDGTTTTVLSPLFNEFFGAQVSRGNFTRVPVAWRRHHTPDDPLDCAGFAGRAVFMHVTGDFWSWTEERDAGVRMQECGALFLINLYNPPLDANEDYVGFSYHTRDAKCCRGSHEVSLVVATGWYDSVRFVEDALNSGQTVNVTLHDLDPNPWDERVFDHAFFLVLMRVLLSGANFITLGLAARALLRRLALPSRKSRFRRSGACGCPKIRTGHLINMALAADAAACLMRGVYCAAGPVFSNGFFTTTTHMFLLNISFPLEVIVLSATIWTFRKLGSLTTDAWVRTKRRMVPLWIVACLSIASEMVAAYFRARRERLGVVVVASVGAYFVFILGVTVMFVVVGRSFLRQLRTFENSSANHPRGCNPTNRRLRRAFTLWVLCDTIPLGAQLLLIVFVVVLPESFYTAEGMFSGYLCLFSLFTMCSLCQVLAFSPRKLSRVGDSPNEPASNSEVPPPNTRELEEFHA